jgi:hypothetical protein
MSPIRFGGDGKGVTEKLMGEAAPETARPGTQVEKP